MKLQSSIIRPTLVSLMLVVFSCLLAYGQSGRTRQAARPAPTKEPAVEKPAASKTAASLRETLDWIREKLETAAGFDDKESQISNKFSSVTIEGCTIRYTMSTRFYSVVDRAAGIAGANGSEISFELRDIDAPNIKAEPLIACAYIISIVTMDNKPKINIGDKASPKTGIYFKEEEMAGRFAKALAHAIKLCQAQKEPF